MQYTHDNNECVCCLLYTSTTVAAGGSARLLITFVRAPAARGYDGIRGSSQIHGIESVSYTHLDVYKRQQLNVVINTLLDEC